MYGMLFYSILKLVKRLKLASILKLVKQIITTTMTGRGGGVSGVAAGQPHTSKARYLWALRRHATERAPDRKECSAWQHFTSTKAQEGMCINKLQQAKANIMHKKWTREGD